VAPDAILGREDELAAIARFYDGDLAGPRALLIEGQAGIGKTTLWRAAVERDGASGGLTLVSRPSEAETRLSFTVLGDLLVPAWEEAKPSLPAGQRKALEAALMADGSAGSRSDARAVSLAVLGVLRAISSTTPLTIAIDDVQWTDAPSARAIVSGVGPGMSMAPSISTTRPPAVAWRSSGSFDMPVASTSSSAFGSSGRRSDTLGGGSTMWAYMVAASVSRRYGTVPVSVSIARQARP